MNNQYLTGKEVQELLKVSEQTIRRWRNSGKIEAKQLSRNKFLYYKSNIKKLMGEDSEGVDTNKDVAIYCRVSTSSQKADLKRQKKILVDFCNSQGYIVKEDYIFTEIASGMNENRENFWKLVDLVLNDKISKIFVTYKDRLTRFGFHYFEKLFEKYGCQIVTMNNMGDEEDFEKELTEDLVSIVHHFSMKMYSGRRNKLKSFEKELAGDENEDKSKT